MEVPKQEPVVPVQEMINEGLSHRAELAESRIDLSTRELNNKSVRNAMLPTLDVFAYYGGSGLGGNLNPAIPACSPTSGTFCFNPAKAPPPFRNGGPVSYGATLNQLVDSTAPDKGVGLTLNIPLRNRTAQANQVRAQLEYRQAEMRLQQLENQVRIEVRNAQFAVRQNRAAVQSAQAAVDLSRQSLDAEQKKLAVGVSTPTTVLQAQAALTTVQSNLVSAMAAYQKSRVELDRATGLLLDHTGIVLADVAQGQVTHMPNAPYVAPRPDLPSLQPGSQPPRRSLTRRKQRPHRARRRLRRTCEGAGNRALARFTSRFFPLQGILPAVKLSVVIITYNEEANLPRTLDSVLALVREGQGEIIVVDSGSTDRTVEIAQSHGAKVFVEPWRVMRRRKIRRSRRLTGTGF